MLHGRYSDGLRPVSHDVEVSRVPGGMEIRISATGGAMIWSLAEARFEAQDGEARLFRVREGMDTGERLVANLAVFQREFAGDLKKFGKGRAGEAGPWRIAAWSAGAIASILAIFFIGLPLLARVAAPLVPLSWEARIGKGVEPQVLDMFGGRDKVKMCGKPDGPGRKALADMSRRLIGNRQMPFPPRIDVLDINVTNAFALPGGRIFLFRTVIERAEGPDEIAGVLAHEMGHVLHRHTMRAIVHDSALSLLVGLVLGDVTGGITASILTSLAGSAYSRDAEREADKVSVEMMAGAGADPTAINTFFQRLARLEGGGNGGLTNLFRSHPVTQERMQAVERLAAEQTGTRRPILSAAEWAALKSICKE